MQSGISLVRKIVQECPAAIKGNIWVGRVPGMVPFVSLVLPKDVAKSAGAELRISAPTLDTTNTVECAYFIKLGSLLELIQKEGFGDVSWQEDIKGTATATIEVIDKGLANALFDACHTELYNTSSTNSEQKGSDDLCLEVNSFHTSGAVSQTKEFGLTIDIHHSP